MTPDSIRGNANDTVRDSDTLAIASLETLEKFLAHVRDIFSFDSAFFNFRHRNNQAIYPSAQSITRSLMKVRYERVEISRAFLFVRSGVENGEAKAASYSVASGSRKIHRARSSRGCVLLGDVARFLTRKYAGEKQTDASSTARRDHHDDSRFCHGYG